MIERICLDCPKPISRRSTGRCRKCANAELAARPTTKAKISAALKRKWASDPAYAANLKAHLLAIMPSPESKRARVDGRAFSEAGHRARWAKHLPGSRERAETGARISAARLAHIPADYRKLYRSLTKKGFSAPEAEAAVLDHAEVERARIRKELMGA